MEDKEYVVSVPTLLRKLSAREITGFDVNKTGIANDRFELSRYQSCNSSEATETETNATQRQSIESEPVGHQRKPSLSVSLPTSPTKIILNDTKEVFFTPEIPSSSAVFEIADMQSKTVQFHSQPMPKGFPSVEPAKLDKLPINPTVKRLKEYGRYDSFKTWSGKLERQISNLRGKPQPNRPENKAAQNRENEALSVDRYFDALEGPELDTLRASEKIVLPEDTTWPFLLRFPISSFGICLGVSSQAIMWKTLATAESTKFLHISLKINLILWCISLLLITVVASIYLLKVILYFEAVRREYYHPIRVNFFFAPWIALLFMALGMPPRICTSLPAALWYVLMAPILCLELKIYGQWMSGGQRRLSKVANPSNHLSIVGNFVGALLGASMGLKEGPIFFFAIGMAHYTVLFVTLYQRLPTNETLPKELHPVFFLFVAAPSVASMAWAKITGSFDNGSKLAYFIALFLYIALVVRVNFFRGFKFSLAWWAYTFPMTGAAISTIKYSEVVTNVLTQVLSVILSGAATLTVTALLVTTIVHAFVLWDLFPNDISIAISDRKPKHNGWFRHLRTSSSENIEHYLKFSETTNGKDIEAGKINKI